MPMDCLRQRSPSGPRLFGRPLAAWALLAALAAPGAALADDAAEARVHFELAARDFRHHAYHDALTHFLAAHRLAPTANTTFNIAQTYVALDRPEDAYRFFRDYLASPAATAGNRARAEQALAEMEPGLARVVVTTDPPGAALYLDRVELGDLGVTPRSIAVTPTPPTHTLIARRAGYREGRATVVAARGREQQVAIRLEPILAPVRVVSEPEGASMELDGQPLDAVTPSELRVPLGRHQLRLRHGGRVDVVRDLVVDDEAGMQLTERLPRDLARAAVLSVVADPGATVTLRGVSLGAAPLSRDVDSGPGELVVTAPGRTPWRRSLLLPAGRSAAVRVELGDPGRSRPAWPVALTFGGAAITIAGAVLGGLALASHQDFDQSPSRAALDQTGTLNLTADVTLGVGVAALVAGIVAWALVPNPAHARATLSSEAIDVRR